MKCNDTGDFSTLLTLLLLSRDVGAFWFINMFLFETGLNDSNIFLISLAPYFSAKRLLLFKDYYSDSTKELFSIIEDFLNILNGLNNAESNLSFSAA